MARNIIVSLLRLILRIFFRHIEVHGAERVPHDGAVLFLLNHPNGLIDPLFILTLAPRPVSFLAKSTLFSMPVISFFVRALDSIPVYRKQDAGQDISKNRETFTIARALLRKGGTIAICPEGVSHNEPRLLPLKSGAARIALGAVSTAQRPLDLQIVPCGLYYTAKKNFRSSALLYFGAPFGVQKAALDEHCEPAKDAVLKLNAQIETELKEVVLNAENAEALRMIERAERVYSSALNAAEEPSLVRQFELRQRFLEGYATLRERAPQRVANLISRITRYEYQLRKLGLDPDELTLPSGLGTLTVTLLARALGFAALLPIAILGAAIHYPAYILVRYLSIKFSHSFDDMVSTIKVIAATLFFPLTWIVAASAAYYFTGWKTAAAVMLLAPLTGYVAVRVFEALDEFVGGARAVLFFVTRRRFFKRLVRERSAIHDEILALANFENR